jgi:TFIIF-interacting CTD phosphatase-like protein
LKKILVLDLDETLIHSEIFRNSDEDIDISIRRENQKSMKIFVTIRPHAISFLKKMSKKFCIVIYTERDRTEADTILDNLDPYQ